MKRLLNRRIFSIDKINYLIKWKEYESQNNVYYFLRALKHFMKLVKQYDKKHSMSNDRINIKKRNEIKRNRFKKRNNIKKRDRFKKRSVKKIIERKISRIILLKTISSLSTISSSLSTTSLSIISASISFQIFTISKKSIKSKFSFTSTLFSFFEICHGTTLTTHAIRR